MMNATDKKKLRDNYVELVRNLNPEDVMDYLYQERVLSEEDCESVRTGPTRAQRMRMFLAILPKKSSDSLAKLLEAMKIAGYIELASEIEHTSLDQRDIALEFKDDPSPVNPTLVLDIKLQELKERLEQQTEVVASMRIEMKQLQEDLKRQSQNYEGNEKYKQTVTVLGELEKEEDEQRDILEEVYETMLRDISKRNEPQNTLPSAVSTLQRQQSLHNYRKYANVKVVLIGDGATGKTSIIHYFITKQRLRAYIPTVFDNRVLDVPVGDTLVTVNFWDTAGQEDYDRLRPLSYSDAHVALLVFSIASQTTFNNVVDKWQPEFKHFCNRVPYILVGNMTDTGKDPEKLNNLKKDGRRLVEAKEADKAAQVIRAVSGKAFLCCALDGDGIASLLTFTVETALQQMRKSRKQGGSCKCM